MVQYMLLRARILKRTREAAALIKGHKHDPTQMMELVRAAILPLFRYSCCFVDWSLRYPEEVGKAWNRAYRAALHLSRSTSAHVLTFPANQGDLELPTPQEILMHEQENLFLQCTSCGGSTAAIVKTWMRHGILSLGARIHPGGST